MLPEPPSWNGVDWLGSGKPLKSLGQEHLEKRAHPSIQPWRAKGRMGGRGLSELILGLLERKVKRNAAQSPSRGPGQGTVGQEGIGALVVKVTSTTGLCTRGSEHDTQLQPCLGREPETRVAHWLREVVNAKR